MFLAGAVLALASCSVEQPTPPPNPHYLDGEYVVDLHSYEYYGDVLGSDTMEFEALCIFEFDSTTLRVKDLEGDLRNIPELGVRFMTDSILKVTYTEGGVRIANGWDVLNGYEGEYWDTFGAKAMVRTEDWSPYGMQVFLQHTIKLNRIK
jgi:hypothetical protein